MKQLHKNPGAVRNALVANVARLEAIEQAAHDERIKLERQLKSAGASLKGTRDMTDAARAAVADGRLEVRMEVALRGAAAPMSVVDLARQLREPAANVQRVLKRLRETPCPTAAADSGAMCVYNHGTDTDPRWSWVIGDDVDAQTLYSTIEVMLRRRPYTFRELQLATGARRGRISGATVEFARGDLPIYTVGGSERRYVWFIGSLADLPAEMRKHARSVKLAPDKNKI